MQETKTLLIASVVAIAIAPPVVAAGTPCKLDVSAGAETYSDGTTTVVEFDRQLFIRRATHEPFRRLRARVMSPPSGPLVGALVDDGPTWGLSAFNTANDRFSGLGMALRSTPEHVDVIEVLSDRDAVVYRSETTGDKIAITADAADTTRPAKFRSWALFRGRGNELFEIEIDEIDGATGDVVRLRLGSDANTLTVLPGGKTALYLDRREVQLFVLMDEQPRVAECGSRLVLD